MGSLRIGTLFRSKPWKAVVALIEQGDQASHVAAAAAKAVDHALAEPGRDPGLVETTHLLLLLPRSARLDPFQPALAELGLAVSSCPAPMDLLAAMTAALDARLANNCGRTDLGEMAQMAAVESLAGLLSADLSGLFDPGPDATRTALAALATPSATGRLFRAFFGRLLYKILDYFLSRTLGLQVGRHRRFLTLGRLAEFSRSLQDHCHETAALVEQFAADWASAAWYRADGPIPREKARDLAHGALRKLVTALRQEGTPDAS